jgi:hypothetical protein
MSTSRVRPSTVTIAVILIWLRFALTLAGAVSIVLFGTGVAASDQAVIAEELQRAELPAEWATTVGPILIVTGVAFLILAIIEAIFAVAIGRGSNVARILLTILIVLRLIGGLVLILFGWGGNSFEYGTFLGMAVGIIMLLLLYNHAANQFFTNEVRAR